MSHFPPFNRWLSVVLQLDKGDYPQNFPSVFCPDNNKQHSFELFTRLDLVLGTLLLQALKTRLKSLITKTIKQKSPTTKWRKEYNSNEIKMLTKKKRVWFIFWNGVAHNCLKLLKTVCPFHKSHTIPPFAANLNYFAELKKKKKLKGRGFYLPNKC